VAVDDLPHGCLTDHGSTVEAALAGSKQITRGMRETRLSSTFPTESGG